MGCNKEPGGFFPVSIIFKLPFTCDPPKPAGEKDEPTANGVPSIYGEYQACMARGGGGGERERERESERERRKER